MWLTIIQHASIAPICSGAPFYPSSFVFLIPDRDLWPLLVLPKYQKNSPSVTLYARVPVCLLGTSLVHAPPLYRTYMCTYTQASRLKGIATTWWIRRIKVSSFCIRILLRTPMPNQALIAGNLSSKVAASTPNPPASHRGEVRL